MQSTCTSIVSLLFWFIVGCRILGSHGSDPLSRVNVAMDDDSGLGALAAATPDMDTSQDSPLDRGTHGDNLRLASVACLQVSEKLEMIRIWVVCSEPRLARN